MAYENGKRAQETKSLRRGDAAELADVTRVV